MGDGLATRHVAGMVDGMRIPVVGLSPMSGNAVMDDANPAGALSAATLGAVRGCLANGLVPLLHGDVVFHRTKGCSILSADAIMTQCAREFHARWVIWATDAPVMDRPPGHPEARQVKDIVVNDSGHVVAVNLHGGEGAEEVVYGSDGEEGRLLEAVIQTRSLPGRDGAVADVTGGMLGKLKAAVQCAVQAGRGRGRADVLIGTPGELTRCVEAFGEWAKLGGVPEVPVSVADFGRVCRISLCAI